MLNAAAVMVEAGVMLASAYMLTRRLWFCIGIHIAWNFTEGGIFSARLPSGYKRSPVGEAGRRRLVDRQRIRRRRLGRCRDDLRYRRNCARCPSREEGKCSSALLVHRAVATSGRQCCGHWTNFSIASALTGVKKLTKLPSGSRNKSERFPQGIVVGA